MNGLQIRLHGMEDFASDEWCEDVILQAITIDYEYVRKASFRKRYFSQDSIKSTT